MMKKRPWLRRLTLSLLIVTSTLVFLLSTTPGLQVSLYLAEKVTQSHIHFEKASGRIIGRVQLVNFVYMHQDDVIRLGKLDISWQPLWLLLGSLDIKKLKLNDGYVRFSSPEEDGNTQSSNQSYEDHLISFLSHQVLSTEINNLTVVKNSRTLFVLNKGEIHIDSGFRKWSVKKLELQFPNYHLSAAGSINKRAPYTVDMSIKANADRAMRRPFSSEIKLSGSLSHLHFLSDIQSPFKATLTGDINVEKKDASIDIKGDWKALRWPLVGRRQYYSDNGHLSVSGLLDNYQIQFVTRIQGTKIPEASINLSGQGSLSKIDIQKVLIKTLSGTIRGTARLPFNGNNRQIKITARNLNPGIKWPQFTGLLNFDLRLNTNKHTSGQVNRLIIENISGNLHQHPVSGAINFEQSNRTFSFKKTQLIIGRNRLKVNGGYSNRWDFSWQAEFPSLKSIDAELKGEVHSQAVIQGAQGKADIKLQATAKNINYGSKIIESIRFNVNGNMAKQTMALFVGNQRAYLKAQSVGQYRSGLWQSTLQTLDLIGLDKKNWHLKQSGPIKISEAQTIIPKHCLGSNKQAICLKQVTIKPNNWRVDVEINRLNPQILQYITPRPVIIHGELNANASFRSDYGIASGVASVNFSRGRVEYTVENETHITPFDFANMKAELNKAGFYSFVELQLSLQHSLKGELNLPDQIGFNMPDSSQRVQSHARLNVTDFSWLDALIPHVDQIKGSGKVMLNLDGTLGKPKFNADVDISHAKLTVPDLGITVSKIHLEGRAKDSNILNYKGSATAGSGTLNVSGFVKLDNMTIVTETHAKGSKIQAVKTHEFDIIATPDITIKTSGHDVNIDGDILIDKASVVPQDFGSTIKLPDDVLIIQRIESHDKARIRSDINIDLGRNTRLSFLGLKGRVVGNINILDAPDKEPIATGQLSIKEGKYTAYGQDLTIEQGNLFYTGNRLDTPGINVKASRSITAFGTTQTAFPSMSTDIVSRNQTITPTLAPTIDKITVGVKVTGSLDKPRISLYSEPINLPQSDILSYLILGRPVRSVINGEDQNGQDTQVLFSALSALNLGGHGTEQITSQIEHTLGIDRLEVTTTTIPDPKTGIPLNNTAIVVGKAITSKLYVDYTIGLLQTLNIIRISYKLSQNWVLQSQTGDNNNSIDLLYTYER